MSSVDGRLLNDRWTEPFDGTPASDLLQVYAAGGATDYPAAGQSLQLLSAEQWEHCVIWMRYKFHKDQRK